MSERTHCQHPDADEPKLTCGHPLPCRYHTWEIDMRDESTLIPRDADMRELPLVVDVRDALVEEQIDDTR